MEELGLNTGLRKNGAPVIISFKRHIYRISLEGEEVTLGGLQPSPSFSG